MGKGTSARDSSVPVAPSDAPATGDDAAGAAPTIASIENPAPATATIEAMLRPDLVFANDPQILAAMDSLTSHPHINRLLQQLWRKDPDTYRHCHRVADTAQAIGKEMGLSAQERVEIYLCGLLHDIGKLLTPNAVLKKPASLTPEEFAVMRLHPEDSGRIVATVQDINYLVAPIRAHHERIDGKGYPDGLTGDKIPVFARIVLVADTFDAMTNNRVYRKQLDLQRTYDELVRCGGTQFDRDAVNAFIALHQRVVLQAGDSLKKAA